MRIRNTKTFYTYTIEFTKEEFEKVRDSTVDGMYLTSYLLYCDLLDGLVEDYDMDYSSSKLEVTLREPLHEILRYAVGKFIRLTDG